MNFKDINIGLMINQRVLECDIQTSRLCNFFDCSTQDILDMYNSKSLDCEILLKWCKILEYDFFRLYSQNLLLYAPVSADHKKNKENSQMPYFRKNIYTKEVINFILEMLEKGEKTKNQIIKEYNIPKTTLYKWIEKNRK